MQDWYYGERNLRYFLTLDKSWLDYNLVIDFSMNGAHPDLNHVAAPWRTLSFGNILSAFGCYVFFVKLHLLNAIEAHQIPNFILMAFTIAALFSFMSKNFGAPSAVIACFALIFQPRLWADSHTNSKDFPYACIMALTLFSARIGILKRNAKWLAAAAVSLGLAGAAKPNAALIPVVAAAWYLFARSDKRISDKWKMSPPGKFYAALLCASPLIAMLSYFAAWPPLWAAPFDSIKQFLAHYLAWAARGDPGFQWGTLGIFILAQPPAALIFGSIGFFITIDNIRKNNRREAGAFLLIWFALPVIRVLLPYAHNYDGVRHFIEYSIPLAGIAAIGAINSFQFLSAKIAEKLRRRQKVSAAFAAAIVAVPFLFWMHSMIAIHPYENVYFNFLMGGAKGVEEFCGGCGVATDYWGSSYLQGIEWLNKNAAQNSVVVVPVAGHIVRSERQMLLRRDISLALLENKDNTTIYEVCDKLHNENIYAMYITRVTAYGGFVYQVESQGKPLFKIDVDGIPILKIMKLERP